ncbi:hypothetical protein JTB14_000655 [Gonioctena quinquepunctata]|nr:hypothetical protein JTB14_000655 [Gonioctena quinquepunctata]
MTELLDFIFEHPRSVVVCGDINVNFLVETAQMLTVRQFFLSYGLDSRVTEITRPNPRGGSLLDNIFTNISEDILQATSLSSESWEQVYLIEDVNNKYKSFYNILFHHFDVAFPLTSKVTRAKSSENSWVNQEIKCYSQYVRDWYRLYTETKCDDILVRYKMERSAYKRWLSHFKKSLNDNNIANSRNKSKTMWNIFNCITNRQNKNGDITLTSGGSTIEDPSEIADIFKSYYDLISNTSKSMINVN